MANLSFDLIDLPRKYLKTQLLANTMHVLCIIVTQLND